MDFSPRYWQNKSYTFHGFEEKEAQQLTQDLDQSQKYENWLDQNLFLPILFFIILFVVVIYDIFCFMWCLRNIQLWELCSNSTDEEDHNVRWNPNLKLDLELHHIAEEAKL